MLRLYLSILIIIFSSQSYLCYSQISGKVSLADTKISSSYSDYGSVTDCLDSDSTTLMRTPANPAWVQIEFSSPKTIVGVNVLLGQIGYTNIDQDDFWVEAADLVSDLNNKSGTFETIGNRQINVAGNWYAYFFPHYVTKRIFRIWIARTKGGNSVHIPEIEFLCPISKIEVVPASLQLFEGWTWHNLPNVRLFDGDLRISNKDFSWASTFPEVADIDSTGKLRATGSGKASITASYKNLVSSEIKVNVKSAVFPPKHVSDEFLNTPAKDAVFEVPIVIINFIPTNDGINVDESYDFNFCRPMTVKQREDDVLAYSRRIKFAIEQGSRFRNYKYPESLPSIGYKVLDYITIYEPVPPGVRLLGYDGGALEYGCDYTQLFERFNIKDLVENKGVKEIWTWVNGVNEPTLRYYGCYRPSIHFPENFRGASESNMASPVSGDISNSYRVPDDLPIYRSSYVVINQSPNRGQTMGMETHTHQFESMLDFACYKQAGSSDLFWNDFVGQIGRCGWTHTPPNTTINYGYFSYIQHDPSKVQPRLSDIEDWTPDNSGEKTLVSYHNWEDKVYDWPDGISDFDERNELQWFIYWMQSIPGYNNNIPYGIDKVISNWWEIIADWDRCIKNGYGLYQIDTKQDCQSGSAPDNNYKLYPNPLAGQDLVIELPANQAEFLNIEISDFSGRIIFNNCYNEKHSSGIIIPKEVLEIPGIYIVRLQDKSTTQSFKILSSR